MDDVILSGVEEEAVEASRLALIAAAEQSGFLIHPLKSQRCAPEITAFNITLSNGQMAITNTRMHEFENDLLRSTPAEAAGIVSYVFSVNRYQAEQLARIALDSGDEHVCAAMADLTLRWEVEIN